MGLSIAISILPLLSLISPLEPPDDDLLNRAAAGNAATVQAIESYYTRVVYSSPAKDQPETPVAEYWRTNDLVRIRDKMLSNSVVDIQSSGGRFQQIVSPTRLPLDPNSIYVTIGDSRQFSVESNAWQLSLFDLPAMITSKPPLFVFSLAELATKGLVHEAKWDQLDGNKVARLSIELKEERRNYVVWVDPKRNWLVVRLIHTIKDVEGKEKWWIEHKIEEFTEIKPSLSIPAATSFSVKYQGKLAKTLLVRFDGLRVNESLPPVPPMPIPRAGSSVADINEGIIYQVDGGGRRTGKVFKIGPDTSGFGDAPRRPAESKLYATWGWALGAGSLSIAAVILIRQLIRHRAA